jgi:hypothetical protein
MQEELAIAGKGIRLARKKYKIMECLESGMSRQEVCSYLGISPQSAQKHLAGICEAIAPNSRGRHDPYQVMALFIKYKKNIIVGTQKAIAPSTKMLILEMRGNGAKLREISNKLKVPIPTLSSIIRNSKLSPVTK